MFNLKLLFTCLNFLSISNVKAFENIDYDNLDNDYDYDYDYDDIKENYLVMHAKRSFKDEKYNTYDNDDDDYIVDDLSFLKNDAFFTYIEIGSNNDTVRVLVDTGSSDFWVAGYNVCEDEADNDFTIDNSTLNYNCSLYGYFDPETSDSFISNDTEFFLSYGDGSIAYGTFGRDTVKFGNFTVNDVNLAIANFTNATSGTIGIGYEATESTDFGSISNEHYKYISFPRKLVEDGIINKASYSLYLDEEGDAEIIFGAVDHSKYFGDLYQFPVVPNNSSKNASITRISITLNEIEIINDDVQMLVGDGYVPALLDSGTTIASFPLGIAETMAELLNMTYNEELGSYFNENCSNYDGVYFNFNFQGVKFESPLSGYLNEIVDEDGFSEGCVFAINTGQDIIILGDSFLKNLYTVIDLDDNNVALAYRGNDTEPSDIEVIYDEIPNATHPPLNETYGSENFLFTFYNLEPIVITTTAGLTTPSVSFQTNIQRITEP